MCFRVFPAVILLALLVLAGLPFTWSRAGTTLLKEVSIPTRDGDMAVNDPDRFNWQLFCEINKPAPSQADVQGGKKTNNVEWETWADDRLTFPVQPKQDQAPVWPGDVLKELEAPLKLQFREQLDGAAHVQVLPRGKEETRRNKEAFAFIIDNKLWYRQGLIEAFNKGDPIQFPKAAIEVKATWKEINVTEKDQFHWNYDKHGVLYGLTGLHIISKTIPNWTWATWEWKGNHGRGDYIGCRDSFGCKPSYVPPNSEVGKEYPPGELTPELLAMFQSAGLSKEWENYRLKGSQVDFTDSTGRATLLGNSIAESGFVQTSSCITCHAVASFDAAGIEPRNKGFTPDLQSFNGAPNPAWFFNPKANPWIRTYLQADFVWGFSKARPLQ